MKAGAPRVEHLVFGYSFGTQFVYGPIVEEQEGRVHAGEDDVLVIPRISQQRAPGGVSRNVLEHAARSNLPPGRVSGIVELRAAGWSVAVNAIEVEIGRALVDRPLRLLLHGQLGRRVAGEARPSCRAPSAPAPSSWFAPRTSAGSGTCAQSGPRG